MNDKFKLPCDNCITLPICKSLVTIEYQMYGALNDSLMYYSLYNVLKKRCNIIEEYISPKLRSTQPYNKPIYMDGANKRRLQTLLRSLFNHIKKDINE